MMLGGLLEELNGGDFGQGMLSAGLSKAIGIGIDGLEGVSDPTKIVMQGIAGGVIAEAEGSGFANGAASFALQFALNQMTQDIRTKDQGAIVLNKSKKNDPKGYASVDDAAKAQYLAHNKLYATTLVAGADKEELFGIIVKSPGSPSRFYFSDMIAVDEQFSGTARVSGVARGSKYAANTHTHRNGNYFSGLDYENPISTGVPYYVRTGQGRVLRWDLSGANKYADRVERLKRNRSTRIFEENIMDEKTYSIFEVCKMGCIPRP